MSLSSPPCSTPLRVARAGRKLGIISDARYRFERGVDPEFVLPGLELATQYDSGLVRRRSRQRW